MARINEAYLVRDYPLTDQVRVNIYYDAIRGYIRSGEPVEDLTSTEVCFRFGVRVYLKSSSSSFAYKIYFGGLELQSLNIFGADEIKGVERKFDKLYLLPWFSMHQPGTSSPGCRMVVRTSYKDLTLDTGYRTISVPERIAPLNPPVVQIERIEANELNELAIYWRHTGGNDIVELQYTLTGQWHKAFTLNNPFILQAFIRPDNDYNIRLRGVDRFDKIGPETGSYYIRSKDYPKIEEFKDFVLSIKSPIKFKIKGLNKKYKTILEMDDVKRLITEENTNVILTEKEIEKFYKRYKENVKIVLRTYGTVYENNAFVNKEYEDVHSKMILSKGEHPTVKIRKNNKVRKGIVYIKKDGKLKTGIIYIRKENKVRRGIL